LLEIYDFFLSNVIIALQPQDFCPAFDAISQLTTEKDAFEEGPEFMQMLSQVNAKLGFFGSDELSNIDVRTLWKWCFFEDTGNTEAPWCSAFSIANHPVLDYRKDLDYYYTRGYGLSNRRLAENLNCDLMQNLLSYLQSDSSTEERVRIFGTHSRTLQLLLVSMGLFEDEFPPTRHNYAQQMTRQWRTGLNAPNGGNLAVIRYE
jgi:Histidine phosphatase superfamily (branch 2)